VLAAGRSLRADRGATALVRGVVAEGTPVVVATKGTGGRPPSRARALCGASMEALFAARRRAVSVDVMPCRFKSRGVVGGLVVYVEFVDAAAEAALVCKGLTPKPELPVELLRPADGPAAGDRLADKQPPGAWCGCGVTVPAFVGPAAAVDDALADGGESLLKMRCTNEPGVAADGRVYGGVVAFCCDVAEATLPGVPGGSDRISGAAGPCCSCGNVAITTPLEARADVAPVPDVGVLRRGVSVAF